MSVIAVKIYEDKIRVAGDGRVITNGDIIESENFEKVIKISDCLIIGITGLADTTGIFSKFVKANRVTFETLNSPTEGLALLGRFKNYLVDNFGFTEGTLKELGGFLIVNKKFHGVFYYDEDLSPFCMNNEKELASFAFGSCGTYTTALLDCGMELEDAIKKSAERYTSINGNVKIVEINR